MDNREQYNVGQDIHKESDDEISQHLWPIQELFPVSIHHKHNRTDSTLLYHPNQ